MNTDYTATKFAFGIFDLGVAYIKGMIRSGFSKDSKRKSSAEILDDLDERVTDLEIKATRCNSLVEDPEKMAKNRDQAVKIEVSQALGLFGETPIRTTTVSSGEGSKETIYVCGKIIKAGDRLVLVSPPGSGKTAWAYQVGICATEGRDPEFIENGVNNRMPQIVEYYDAELDIDDRSSRYGNYLVSPLFHLHDNCRFRTFYHLLKDVNERTVNLTSDAMVIIDNVFGVMPGMSTDETRTFLDGLDVIQRRLLDKGIRLTIILITHTTKDVVGVPRLKDVAGSAHFARFAKSVMSLFLREDEKTVLVTNKRRYKGDKNALVMQLSEERYLHFDLASKDSIDANPAGTEEAEREEEKETGERVWTLSEDELSFASEVYVPDNYGIGSVAKDILIKRGWEITDASKAQMKNSVIRALTKAELYKPKSK